MTYLVGTVVSSDLLSHDKDSLVSDHLLLHGGGECLSDGLVVSESPRLSIRDSEMISPHEGVMDP